MTDRVIIAPGIFYIEQKHCFLHVNEYNEKMADLDSPYLFCSDECPMYILIGNIIYQCVLNENGDDYIRYSHKEFFIKAALIRKYGRLSSGNGGVAMYLKDDQIVFFEQIQRIEWSFARDLIDGKKPNV